MKKISLEDMIEKAGGWKHGMREKFDYALYHHSPSKIKKLLPNVPKEYLSRGFGKQAYEILLKNAKRHLLK